MNGFTQNELIRELSKTILTDRPVRVVQVDKTRLDEPSKLRVEGVEVVDGELHLVIDNHAG